MQLSVVADQSLMAVRVVLYDLRKPDGIEPQIQFGVMSAWKIGSDEPSMAPPELGAVYFRVSTEGGSLGLDQRVSTTR